MHLSWSFADIYLTLDTFGGEATCSSPDVVAVASANSSHFVVFWLTRNSFGGGCCISFILPFADIYFTLDTFGGEATCSSPDVVAVASANSSHFVVFWLTTSFCTALLPFADIYLTLDTFGGEATCSSPDVVAVASANSAHFVAFWLTTSFGTALWTFADISLTLDTFGGEATCSSPDVACGGCCISQ